MVFEAAHDEAGWRGIVRIGASGSIVWHHKIPGFNVGQPLVENQRLFVSAIGYLAALSLQTGDVRWEHGDLYFPEDGAFSAFQPPQVSSDALVFWESSVGHRRPITGITVDPETGEMSRL